MILCIQQLVMEYGSWLLLEVDFYYGNCFYKWSFYIETIQMF